MHLNLTLAAGILTILIGSLRAQYYGWVVGSDYCHCPKWLKGEYRKAITWSANAKKLRCHYIGDICYNGTCSISVAGHRIGLDVRAPSKVGVCKDPHCSQGCRFMEVHKSESGNPSFKLPCMNAYHQKYMIMGMDPE